VIEGIDFSIVQTMRQVISLIISKTKKITDYYFYQKGENDRITDWKDTQIKTYIGF
jgi:hypothetical protein